MLISLRIENFTIVQLLELDFSAGMTVFTGETGAGKSIMIDALMLALGDRADNSVVRPGAEKCEISASFHFDRGSPPELWLKEHDLEWTDELIILRRAIYAEGRSKSYINGQPFPLHKIKELSEMLVDIHGQHQHQTLLQPNTHRLQLDQYAGHLHLLQEVAGLYRECQRLEHELTSLVTQDASDERAALLQYQLQEITELHVKENEFQKLYQEHQLLHHAKDYLSEAHCIMRLLNADDEPNVHQLLHQIMQSLMRLPQANPLIQNAVELINNALIQCQEAEAEIASFSEEVQLDPERLFEVEERISLLHAAARKFNIDVNALCTYQDTLQAELQQVKARESKFLELQKKLVEKQNEYEQAALKLRESRLLHSEALAEEITRSIRQLGMPKGYIQLEITPLEKMHPHGMDKVEYKVCTNPGMVPDSLAKVASGGELSRISLAIQMITAQRASTPTLLFDEVDVGIGGPTAALVGQLLRKLGQRLQVFCVTHQPQVASAAHHHFVVEKYTDEAQTFSRIVPLSADRKVDEIARMLGGLTITEQTRSHARELLQSADMF